MKKLQKEQLPKVIALGAMTVVLLGYAGYTWLGHGGGEATPAAAASPHPVGPAPTTPAAPTAADKVLSLPPIHHENPFQPAFTAESGPAPKAPAIAMATKPKTKNDLVAVASVPDTLNGPAMDSLPPLPPMTTGPAVVPSLSSAGKATAPTTGTASHRAVRTAPAPPKPPAVLVTGILEGQENVAILKWSDTQRQVVRTGDHLDGGYVVKAIRSDAVVLSLGSSEWVMRLGTATKG